MIRKIKFILVLAVSALFLLALTLGVSANSDGHDVIENTPIPQTTLYGRTALSTLENSTALLYAYDAIAGGIAIQSESINVYNGMDPLTEEELNFVFDAYRRDYSEHFWLGTSFRYSYNTVSVTVLYPEYIFNGEGLVLAKEAFAESAKEILSLIDDSMSDLKKEEIIHDALAKKVLYVESDNAHNAYGALVEGIAVCEGYAEALSYLFRCAGLESFIALGTSISPETGNPENHAWNYVKIDSEYYHVDLTWNDQPKNIFKAYFNLTDDAISEDHTISDADYPLPVCNSTEKNYFSVYGGSLCVSDFSAAKIAEALINNNFKASFFVEDNVNEFVNLFYSNINDIATLLNITGTYSYGYSKLGRQVVLEIITCKHNSLTKILEKPASCEVNGNCEYYVCECGAWFFDCDATLSVADERTTVIFAVGHTFSEKNKEDKYLKSKASDCASCDEYWYSCKDCQMSAQYSKSNSGKYFSADWGDHILSDKPIGKDGYHAYVCTVPSCTYSLPSEACRGGKASCEMGAVCDVCGDEYTPKAEHETDSVLWEYDSQYHYKPCLVCDKRENETAHSDTDGDLLCDVCSAEIKSSQGSFLDNLGIDEKTARVIVICFIVLIVLISTVAGAKRKKG